MLSLKPNTYDIILIRLAAPRLNPQTAAGGSHDFQGLELLGTLADIPLLRCCGSHWFCSKCVLNRSHTFSLSSRQLCHNTTPSQRSSVTDGSPTPSKEDLVNMLAKSGLFSHLEDTEQQYHSFRVVSPCIESKFIHTHTHTHSAFITVLVSTVSWGRYLPLYLMVTLVIISDSQFNLWGPDMHRCVRLSGH